MIHAGRQSEYQILRRGGAGIDGQAAPLEQRLQSGDMIGVGVGDQNGGKLVRGQPHFPERGSDAPAGDAGVQQQMGAAAADQDRISGRAAGQSMYGGQKRSLASSG